MMTEGKNLEAMLDDDLEMDAPEMAQPETEQVEQDQTGETELEATPADDQSSYDNSPMVPRKALEDERRKRQDYERQVQEYSAWIQQQQAQQQQPRQQEPEFQPPDPWTDPQGALQYQQQQLQTEFQSQIIATRVETSRHLMRMQHADYDDMEKVFDEVCASQPHLLQQAAQHPFPAQYAYETAKRALVWQRYEQNPQAFEAALNGQPQIAQQSSQPGARVPVSLAQRTSSSPRNDRGQFVERASIDDLLDG